MKKPLLFLFVLIPFTQSFGQDTIVSIAYTSPQPVSYFEDRDTANYFYFDQAQPANIWQIGTPSKAVFNSAHSPTLALVTDTLNTYPDGNQSSFEFVIASDDVTIISFWHRFDSDSLADGGVVEVSFDGGINWTNVILLPQFTLSNFYTSSDNIASYNNQPGFTGSSGWVQSSMVSGSLNYVRFRFTFSSDNTNTNKDGWMLDDFNFICLGTGIEEIGLNSLVRLYPNPTQGIISVRAENNVMIYGMKLKDIQGRELLSGNSETLDLTPFARGLYFLEVSTNKGMYSARVQRR